MKVSIPRCTSLTFALAATLAAPAAFAQLHPSPETDMYAPQNSTKLMPNAPLGSQYPSHGNAQAGELNLNPSDPRAQLVNGLPNNANSGGYGSPLAGNKANVPASN
ncbi:MULTISPECIES: hypothetical protein [unclassified Caballeronia]|uniref:hypothetical protein n=1 Tax=unclassified Caballeronia TaxID=2646786 RepID=UPI00286C07C2|nr:MULTISPECIES: hypothetical protein [unclassified Caballeronia]